MKQFTAETLQAVLNRIPHGKQFALHQSELSQMLDMHPQTLKQIIRELRMEYDNVLSGPRGYWISDNPAERAAYYKRERQQALTRLKTTKKTGEGLKELAKKQQGGDSDYGKSADVI